MLLIIIEVQCVKGVSGGSLGMSTDHQGISGNTYDFQGFRHIRDCSVNVKGFPWFSGIFGDFWDTRLRIPIFSGTIVFPSLFPKIDIDKFPKTCKMSGNGGCL